ncbi:MAG: hypothetical protein JNK89_02820, partial [Saprospiraceae bacterium]|nr:hypothetical protein [Saprospiraceae bacterium]
MKKLQFPSALTVLVLLAALVAGLTWLIPSGEFDRLSYDKEQKHFVHRHAGRDTILPANQGTLDRLGVGIPLEKFTSGDIWKPVAVPGSYRPVEGRPQGFVAFLQAPLKGIVEAIDVILFVLILGGCIGAVHQSGAFDAGVGWLARRLQGREALLIVVITCLITAGGTTFGMAEETIAFYPILVPVFLAAGYDAMVALAAIYIGSSLG